MFVFPIGNTQESQFQFHLIKNPKWLLNGAFDHLMGLIDFVLQRILKRKLLGSIFQKKRWGGGLSGVVI